MFPSPKSHAPSIFYSSLTEYFPNISIKIFLFSLRFPFTFSDQTFFLPENFPSLLDQKHPFASQFADLHMCQTCVCSCCLITEGCCWYWHPLLINQIKCVWTLRSWVACACLRDCYIQRDLTKTMQWKTESQASKLIPTH